MLVSWEWLSDYVKLDAPLEQVVDKWALSGLNHESTEWVEGVPVIDLEVTSNRADCLGHIGVAREASVLFSKLLTIPQPEFASVSEKASAVVTVENRFEDACSRYTARVIRGVKVGPSPEWFAKRLRSIGVKPINNVVDVTNYVMMEIGQPLHAFDLSRVSGGKIVVRRAVDKESFVAIDHRTYLLDSQMVVIADGRGPLALGGVMGGLESEVSESTVDLLIEAASFAPMSIRRAARKLKLHSPSSYRFERRIDPNGLDWASRRCCQLIQQFAGGEVLEGVVDSKQGEEMGATVSLRRARVRQVLGIEVPWEQSKRILEQLGCEVTAATESELSLVAPTYRQDLTREADLIEEIVRVVGYDAIPEDAMVPMVSSARRPKDIMMGTLRAVACAAGFDETLNPSLIGKGATDRISPWCAQDPLVTAVPLLEGAAVLRRSLIPSLIAARLHNQSQSIRDVRLFETANVYLPQGEGLPKEQLNFGCIAESDPRLVRGVFEECLGRIWGSGGEVIEERVVEFDFLERGTGIAWYVDGAMLGWVGSLSKSLAQGSKIDGAVAIGELDLDLLLSRAVLVPRLRVLSPYPAILRDLNFIVDEAVQWQGLRNTIERAAGKLCKEVVFREVYRDTKKDGVGKKRILLTLTIQSDEETLRGEQADVLVASIIAACQGGHAAQLLA
jgi:phenylalanyl-tRNA synthetase beta chain